MKRVKNPLCYLIQHDLVTSMVVFMNGMLATNCCSSSTVWGQQLSFGCRSSLQITSMWEWEMFCTVTSLSRKNICLMPMSWLFWQWMLWRSWTATLSLFSPLTNWELKPVNKKKSRLVLNQIASLTAVSNVSVVRLVRLWLNAGILYCLLAVAWKKGLPTICNCIVASFFTLVFPLSVVVL